MKQLIPSFGLLLLYYHCCYYYLLAITSFVDLGNDSRSSILWGVNGWTTTINFQKSITSSKSSSRIPLGMNSNTPTNVITNNHKIKSFFDGVVNDNNHDDVDLWKYLQRKGIPWMLYHDLPMPNISSLQFPSFERHYPKIPTRLYKPTYAMIVSYYGPSFTGGYEFNPNLPSHQRSVRESITNHISYTINTNKYLS